MIDELIARYYKFGKLIVESDEQRKSNECVCECDKDRARRLLFTVVKNPVFNNIDGDNIKCQLHKIWIGKKTVSVRPKQFLNAMERALSTMEL